MDLKFNFDEVKQSRKQFLRNFFTHYSSAEEQDSYTFKLRLDNLKIDLQNILRLIDTQK
jgi:alanine racemase